MCSYHIELVVVDDIDSNKKNILVEFVSNQHSVLLGLANALCLNLVNSSDHDLDCRNKTLSDSYLRS